MIRRLAALALLLVVPAARAGGRGTWVDAFVARYQPNARPRSLDAGRCAAVLSRARSLVNPSIRYDPAYVAIGYPGGDVPRDTGVCADVIVRAFRAAGLDLQSLIHDDARASYPPLWDLRRPDPNIDHRRVPNLMTYFARHGAVLPLADDFQPCDVVAFDLGGGVTHIGLLSDRRLASGRLAVIHHIGGHPTEEDVLSSFRRIGHFAF